MAVGRHAGLENRMPLRGRVQLLLLPPRWKVSEQGARHRVLTEWLDRAGCHSYAFRDFSVTARRTRHGVRPVVMVQLHLVAPQ